MRYNLFDYRSDAMEKPIAGPSKDPYDAGRADPFTEQTDSPNQETQFSEGSTLTSQERGEEDYEIIHPGAIRQKMLRDAECLVEDLHGAGLMTAECATIMKPVMHELLSTIADVKDQMLTVLDQTNFFKTQCNTYEKENVKLRKELEKLRHGHAARLLSTIPEEQVSQGLESLSKGGNEPEVLGIEHDRMKVGSSVL
jgi:regulator of replication initiation timing